MVSLPEPLKTTPLTFKIIVPLISYLPASSFITPRKPVESGNAEAACCMALFISEVLSPIVGDNVAIILVTFGMGTLLFL
jgi:hypothetical protein